MYIVQLRDISRDNELAAIVVVSSATSEDDAIQKAAHNYTFRDGYTAVATMVNPELTTQEIFNRYDD